MKSSPQGRTEDFAKALNGHATGIDIPTCCAIIRISVDQHLTMIALIAASS
jgi:hypothetical protein